MKIVIAGGTGFIGKQLVERFLRRGDDVFVLSRDPRKVGAGRGLKWDPRQQGAWSADVSSADVVINLAGENIGEGRWTEARKKRFVTSRVETTKALVSALHAAPRRARTFISASAVGFYGDRGDEELDETSSSGKGFVAGLCREWESAAQPADAVARLVILRFGVVLAGDGGALAKMVIPFRFGAGGRIASGRQWMSWVDRDDALRFIEWAIDQPNCRGTYNVTSPKPVRNGEFTRAIGRVLHRPALLPVPAFALRLVFGDMADETLVGGQRVLPRRAVAQGFRFDFPEVQSALVHSLRA